MSKVPFNGNAGVGTFPLLTLYPVPTSGDLKVFINPGDIVDVTTNTSGSNVTYYDQNEMLKTVVVSETPATIAAQIGRVPLTIVENSVTTTHWYGISQIHNIKASGSGSTVSISPAENQNTQVKYATETPAAIMLLIEAALPAAGGGGGGGGGSSQTLVALGTNQATAAAVTARVVRIDATSAAGTGIRLDAATAGEFHFIYNAATFPIFIYPAVGEYIDPELVNQPLLLGTKESLYLGSTLAGHWSATVAVSSIQNVTPSGTVQGGGLIKEGVTQAIVTGAAAGNTAVTLPAATVGARINVNNIGGSAALRLYPAGTDQINAGGAGIYTNLHADSSIDLMCNAAGLWVDVTTYVKNLFVDSIAAKVTGGVISINDVAASPIARFSSGIEFFKDVQLLYAEGPSQVGGGQGGTHITANIFNVTTCATLGDSVTLSGGANFYWITNSGAAPLYVYANTNSQMNGVLNGYVIVAPGQVVQLNAVTEPASVPIWTSTLLYSPPLTYTASAATPPHIISPSANITSVPVALDAVILDNQCPFTTIKNDGAETAVLLPTSGDTINGLASLLLPVGSIVSVMKVTSGGGFVEWVATFDAPGRQSGVAFSGGGQASGTPIVGAGVNVTTVAVANDSFTIQPLSPRMFYFSNNGANACDVFPPSGGTINGGGVNIALSVPFDTTYIFTSNDGLTWIASKEQEYVDVLSVSAFLPNGLAAGTYILEENGVFLPASGSMYAPPFYLETRDQTVRLLCAVITNGTDPASNISFGLQNVSAVGGVGALVSYTLSGAVATSPAVSPSAFDQLFSIGNSTNISYSGNCLAITVTLSAPIAAGAHVHICAKLQVVQ